MIISVFNNKGGVGKTTIAVNLASVLADDAPVLIVDNDPQANTTSAVGARSVSDGMGITIAYRDGGGLTPVRVGFSEAAQHAVSLQDHNKQLFLVPGSRDLRGYRSSLEGAEDENRRLSNSLETLRQTYSYIIIDCPPAVDLFSISGLMASDAVIIPFKPGRAELDGANNLQRLLKELNEKRQRTIQILGVIINMYTHTRVSRYFSEQVMNVFDSSQIIDTIISASVRYMEAAALGLPIDLYLKTQADPNEEYRSLKSDILSRMEEIALW